MIIQRNQSRTHAATLSACGTYRYRLWRSLDERVLSGPWALGSQPLIVVMLNPSTADGTVDDATIRTLMGYGRKHDYDQLLVANLYALRATMPAALRAHPDPVGPENDETLRTLPRGPVLVAFGGDVMVAPRLPRALELLAGCDLVCLGTTKAGMPRHPLRIAHSTPLVPWRAP